jgi:hypothetical protein
MRKLVWAVLILAALWAGYWAVGATAVKRGLTAWLDEQRSQGLQVAYSGLSVAGFPNRFDVTLTDPAFANPADGTGWRAPFLQVMALSYQPQHYIAVWPHEQTLTLGGTDIAIASQDMRASVVFSPGPSFVLNRTTLVADHLSALDWAADTLRFATRRTSGDELAHEVGVEALNLALPGAERPVDRLHLDATVGFDRRIDRFADQAQPTRVELRDLSLDMGEARVSVTGTLTGTASGTAEGELRLVARNWRQLVDLAVAAGLLPEANRPMTETALRLLSADSDAVDSTLTLRDGLVMLGPIPLGPAPAMVAP